MSADNWITLDIKTFDVCYGQGDMDGSVFELHPCRSLKEAVKKAKELDDVLQLKEEK